jgi:hypothetical protein
MNKNILLFALFVLLKLSLQAQEDTIAQRIVLIGDAGQLTNGKHPVVDAVRNFIKLDKKTTVLYLGDNLYRKGLPNDESNGYVAARSVLDSQLSIADGTPAKVYMIPGNHDWENGSSGGYEAILRQQLYVDFIGKKNVKYYPEDGCPGPVEINLGNDVVMILFDSQWWIHPYDKPGIESDCNFKTKEQLVAQIADLAARNSKKLIIIACHHPFKSNGVHGGLFTPKQHIFPFTDIFRSAYIPLPVIGSVYPVVRSVFGTPQDLKHPNYADMINRISAAVKAVAPNVIFVSGHEHNLQHIKDSSYNYIISGSGCKEQRVSKSKKSVFTTESNGFSVLEVSKNKIVTASFYTVTDSIRNPYNTTLLNFSKIPPQFLEDSAKVETDPFAKYKDTINSAANPSFTKINGIKKLFMGENYRAEWRTPVNMKVFNLKKEKGGMTIVSLGGDGQSTSLRLKDASGKEWTLKSINKNLTKILPETIQGGIVKVSVTEFNSAAFPYSSFIVPPLLKNLNLQTPNPELFFVPDDPAFSFYRKLFADKVCTLEEREPSSDGSNTISTAKVFGKMIDENDHRPDQAATLRARLLDIVIGDFDRHFDQWKWSISDTGKGKIYTPIPKSREMAFFYSKGLQIKLFGSRAFPFLRGFRNNIPSINWLGYGARDFDRIFLTDLDAEEWRESITAFQQSLSDSVIRNAVTKLPPEIFPLRGETIIKKMISRRNMLGKEGMTYYKFISNKVNVIGSNDKEYFKVSNAENGLQVRVYARSKGNDTSFIMYNRIFDPAITHEIRLFGLNDDDLFEIDSSASSRIKFRIIGGKGNDTFDIKGHVENLLYDIKSDLNFIRNSSQTKNRFSVNSPVNDNSITGFQYNTTKFPEALLSYNSDEGASVGIGISKRTHGFRNLPYASDQKFAALYYWAGAYQFYYKGEFNHVTRNLDVLLQVNSVNPGLHNFFGLGNKTEIDASKHDNFYRTRYKTVAIEAMLRKRYFEKFHLMFGPYYFQYSNNYKFNTSNVLSKPQFIGLDSADIFRQKTYLGGKATIHLDNRNDEVFPTRGIHWDNEFLYVAGIKNGSGNYSRITSDMTVYISQNNPAKVVAVLKLGAGRILSKQFEYFQALTLGNNTLQGFRKNRYQGSATAYGSLELRIKLFDVNSYTLSGPFGLTGFYDIGRVWLKKERSKGLHSAFGGGLYFVPFNLFVITASAGFSESDKVINFSIGTKVNITY